ncbi:hypothetical protein RRG08_061541 [Elysia crispata]|nr:hypothetical protein RRG08_061541 [Elysia crispata]
MLMMFRRLGMVWQSVIHSQLAQARDWAWCGGLWFTPSELRRVRPNSSDTAILCLVFDDVQEIGHGVAVCDSLPASSGESGQTLLRRVRPNSGDTAILCLVFDDVQETGHDVAVCDSLPASSGESGQTPVTPRYCVEFLMMFRRLGMMWQSVIHSQLARSGESGQTLVIPRYCVEFLMMFRTLGMVWRSVVYSQLDQTSQAKLW